MENNDVVVMTREIDEMIDLAANGADYEGMTYAEGVMAALEWILGYTEEEPL